MTIDELKHCIVEVGDPDDMNREHWALLDLAPEILALVEALQEADENDDWYVKRCEAYDALHAFNAKLASL